MCITRRHAHLCGRIVEELSTYVCEFKVEADALEHFLSPNSDLRELIQAQIGVKRALCTQFSSEQHRLGYFPHCASCFESYLSLGSRGWNDSW
jgi:hypothetical protein